MSNYYEVVIFTAAFEQVIYLKYFDSTLIRS